MTGQCRRVAKAVERGMIESGAGVKAVRIYPVDQRYVKLAGHFSYANFLRLVIEPLFLKRIRVLPDVPEGDRYDLVVIGSQTWSYSPSIPIYSFVTDPKNIRLFQQSKVAVFITCRTYWKRNLKILKKWFSSKNVRVVDEIAFQFPGKEPARSLSTLSYLRFGKVKQVLPWVRLPAYGVTEKQLLEAQSFGRRLVRNHLSDRLGFDKQQQSK